MMTDSPSDPATDASITLLKLPLPISRSMVTRSRSTSSSRSIPAFVRHRQTRNLHRPLTSKSSTVSVAGFILTAPLRLRRHSKYATTSSSTIPNIEPTAAPVTADDEPGAVGEGIAVLG